MAIFLSPVQHYPLATVSVCSWYLFFNPPPPLSLPFTVFPLSMFLLLSLLVIPKINSSRLNSISVVDLGTAPRNIKGTARRAGRRKRGGDGWREGGIGGAYTVQNFKVGGNIPFCKQAGKKTPRAVRPLVYPRD